MNENTNLKEYIEEELSLKLLAGDSINIDGIGNIYPLKLKEIKDMGEQIYNYFLSVLTIKPDETPNNISLFDFILQNCIYGDEQYRYLVLHALACFLKDKITLREFGFIVGDSEDKFINKDNYNEIYKIILLQNCLKNQIDEYNPANERAKELIERLKKSKANKTIQKNNANLASVISGVVWKSKNIDIFNVWDLTVYQLYDALYRLNILDEFDNMMFAYYTGNIRKEDIDFKNLSWVKKYET